MRRIATGICKSDRLYGAALAHDPDNFDLLHFLCDVAEPQ